jgi:hypothetical protein
MPQPVDLRDLTNKPGAVYTPAKTTVIYAEDWALIKSWISWLLGLFAGKQDSLGFTPENVANKKINLSDDSDIFYPSQKAVKTAVDAKQNSLGFTAENIENKSTTLDTDKASDTKYPSVKSVYDWAVGLFATIANLALKAPINAATFTGVTTIPYCLVNNTGFYIKDTGGVYRIQWVPNETNTATRIMYYKSRDGNRNLTLGADLNINGSTGVAWAKYSFAVNGGAVSTITPAVAFNTVIPDNAIITSVIINSTTALTSAGAATVSIGTSGGSSASALLGVTGYATFTLDKLLAGVPVWTAPIKMTASGSITFTIAGAALTAGIIEVFVSFYVPQA